MDFDTLDKKMRIVLSWWDEARL